MRKQELDAQALLYRPSRKLTGLEVAEMLSLVRLLASYGCAGPGDKCCLDKRGASKASNLCGPCHAQQLLKKVRIA
jgi:hypothetical protein